MELTKLNYEITATNVKKLKLMKSLNRPISLKNNNLWIEIKSASALSSFKQHHAVEETDPF